jgi:hypothetical protein
MQRGDHQRLRCGRSLTHGQAVEVCAAPHRRVPIKFTGRMVTLDGAGTIDRMARGPIQTDSGKFRVGRFDRLAL